MGIGIVIGQGLTHPDYWGSPWGCHPMGSIDLDQTIMVAQASRVETIPMCPFSGFFFPLAILEASFNHN
ncbi:hypothetical protein NIES208_02120 [[Limnothrix rosea] IAM M-220]|nr:hypothetical protein NIES208_02120 [[Limnothrix rosea] IAM M-220]